MKIKVFAYVQPESITEAGQQAGLSEEAVEYFRHTEEFEIELDVDPENGAVCGGRLLSYQDET